VTEKRKESEKKTVRAKQAATRKCNKEYKEEGILEPAVSIATLQNTVF